MEKQLEGGCDTVLQEDLEIVANTGECFNGMDGTTVLVTGATGLVGSLFVKSLLCRNRTYQSGIRVLALVRNKEKADALFADVLNRKELTFIYGDVSEPIAYTGNIDYIVHAASMTTSKYFISNPVETLQTTIRGTENMLQLAKEKKVRSMVYISSMEVYGITDASLPAVTEKDLGYIDILNVRSCYSEGKRIAECMCSAYASEYGVPVKMARLAQTFGAGIPLAENRVFAQFAHSAMEKKDIVLHTAGESTGNYSYTRDSVLGILLIMTKGINGEAYTVANEQSTTKIKDMAAMVAHKIAKDEIKVIFDIPESNLTYGYAPDVAMHLSGEKLRKLGFVPSVGLEECYRRMIKSLELRMVGEE